MWDTQSIHETKIYEKYSFLSFTRKSGNTDGKKNLEDNATKKGIDTSMTGSERLKQKPVNTTADLTGKKLACKKILALNKVKPKDETSKNVSRNIHTTR